MALSTVLVFAGALFLVSVLLSGFAERTVLSTAVLFLLAGFFAGGGGNFLALRPEDPLVSSLAELALFAVLFTDGIRFGALLAARPAALAVSFLGTRIGWRKPTVVA